MKKLIDGILGTVTAAMPDGNAFDSAVTKDMEKNIKAMLQSALGRLDVVPKEEFEVQQRLLARLTEKVERLEKMLEDSTVE